MNNKGAIELSLTTIIVIILSIVALGAGIMLVKNILTVTELPAFQSGMPQFFSTSIYPEKGQIGTVFKLTLELTNKSDIYLINAKITKLGRAVKTIPLYDDGSHGDGLNNDGIYASTWDSKGIEEGIYGLDITINPSESQIEYANVSSLKVFRQNCEPLIYNGNPSDKVDVAIVPYGYTDLKKFRQDALEWLTRGLLTYEPFKSEQSKFNFYIVNQLDADFTCTRDENTRTLMYCEDSKVEKEASQCPADQIVVILNEAEFCGTASFYARACNGWNLKQVLTHEFGHTFGGLGDEYSYASTYPGYQAIEATYPNCDIAGCNKWYSIEPGCFQGCGFDNFFRATKDNCLMKKYTNTFCPVCRNYMSSLLDNYREGIPQLQAAPPAEKTYIVDLNYDNGTLAFKDAYVTSSMAPDRKIARKSDYLARLVSFDGKEIYSFNFELPNVLLPPPPQNENESGPPPIVLDKLDWAILAPQNDNASKLDIYDKNKKLLSIDLGYLSNSCGDGKCEAHESAVECPIDCKGTDKDQLCNYNKDSVCDADCTNIDPDCRSINLILLALIGISIVSILIIIIASQIKEKD